MMEMWSKLAALEKSFNDPSLLSHSTPQPSRIFFFPWVYCNRLNFLQWSGKRNLNFSITHSAKLCCVCVWERDFLLIHLLCAFWIFVHFHFNLCVCSMNEVGRGVGEERKSRYNWMRWNLCWDMTRISYLDFKRDDNLHIYWKAIMCLTLRNVRCEMCLIEKSYIIHVKREREKFLLRFFSRTLIILLFQYYMEGMKFVTQELFVQLRSFGKVFHSFRH
jgi:hypothetical protein